MLPKPFESETMTGAKLLSDPAAFASALGEQFLAHGRYADTIRERTRFVESQVCESHSLHLASSFPRGLAVLAVGGFGRAELFPHSDVDLCLLVENEKLAQEKRSSISAFLQSLWDAGFRASHSVRTVSECCELHDQNVELNISLLDLRPLAGDLALFEALEPRLRKFYDNQSLQVARHLTRLARSRRAQFHDSIYHLEPNVKESPGGLRDLQLLDWFRKLRITGMDDFSWQEELEPARAFLYQVRCFLHYHSNRDNNVLGFEAQDHLTEWSCSPHPTPEEWMRQYFLRARCIFAAAARAMESVEVKNNSLLAGFRDWRSRLSNSDFTVARDRVFFKAPHAMEQDPELALRLFQFVARHGIRLSLESERRIQEAMPRLAEFFASPRPLWSAVHEILSQPHAALALRSMQDTAVLRLLFPEWAGIECCVVRDFYHRYTVDEHTLVTIENLQNLAKTTLPGHRRFATLLTEIEDPAVIRFALLFHDVGKGARTGNHSEESVIMAEGAMNRIRVPEKAKRMVLFLIQQHLALSSAMTSRDLDDPATARMIAAKVGTIEALKCLAVLTYTDIAAVNPGALTPWRLEQLWRVYMTTHHELTRELQTDRIENPSAGEEQDSFLKGLPVRYLRTHTDEEIRVHFDLEQRRKDAEVAIDIRRMEGGYMLTVLAKDRLALFASIAGALSSFGMNILKAEAFANQQGTILDTFVFADPSRTLELNPSEMERLQLTIERVLLGRTQVKDLLKYRPKPALPSRRGAIPPRVTFDNDASGSATLVEITAEDRPGLLYDIASCLSSHGCNIELVLVDTEAHKAMDVFYVSSSGRKVPEALMQPLRNSLEQACAAH